MKLKKRNKKSRARGDRTLGWAMKKHKGSGNRGGFGMAGTGKRADQRKTWVIKYQYPYFGKLGFTGRSTERKKNDVMNLSEIENKFSAGEVILEGYKILGTGDITKKFTVKAKAFSNSAKEKIEKAGGKIIIEKKEKKEEEKPEAEKKKEGKKKVKVKKEEEKK